MSKLLRKRQFLKRNIDYLTPESVIGKCARNLRIKFGGISPLRWCLFILFGFQYLTVCPPSLKSHLTDLLGYQAHHEYDDGGHK